MPARAPIFVLLLAILGGAGSAGAAERRLVTLEDLARLRTVSDPQVSPDGAWVAYVVATPDFGEDESNTDLWMTSFDGAHSVRLTWDRHAEETPRWSPEGRHLAFLSDRDDPNEETQLWVLDRTGGEGRRLTEFKGGVSDYAWSPDGKRLALVVEDPDPEAEETGKEEEGKKKKKKTPKPIVIDRYQFKEDRTGYLGARRSHLYVLELESRKAWVLTPGGANEALPSWSPDGTRIAFVSKRQPDIDRTDNWDLFVAEARDGAEARRLTSFEGSDSHPDWESPPDWSPDGRSIAYLQGGPPRMIYYALPKLAVIPSAGGSPRLLTAKLDRAVSAPRFSSDGSSILFLLEDDGSTHLARVGVKSGEVERLVTGRRMVSAFSPGPGRKLAYLASTPSEPAEVFALETGEPRRLSRQNDEWLSGVRLGAVETSSFRSKDGTEIHGFLVKPPDFLPGRKYPAILRIHGGPVSQFASEFDFDWQLFAARGYVVVAANPRGSSGRGDKFAAAIYGDWGNKDLEDVLAAVDDAVRRGIADPARLGVGGWSYGGILTNYVIVRDTRFKAAVSGASISNILAGYGTDQYIREYELELGPPWRNPDLWVKLSDPFLHADRIVTPTLFLCGDKDFNVPLLNSEQMYQALRSLGRDTQLVMYPGQYHEIRKPSYLKDRLERYLGWYGKYLKP